MTERVDLILDFLDRGWVGSVISLVGATLGIAGILVGYVFYRRSRIGPRLAYHQRFDRLIGGGKPLLPKEVEIYFAGQKVQRLTKTLLAIWNYGTATVHGSSVVSDDPIRFAFPEDVLVLKPRVIAATRATNKLTVALRSGSSNEVICQFDYLDVGDGGVIEVLHTGDQGTASVLGSVRGVPTGLEDVSGAEHLRSLGLNPKFFGVFLIFTIIGLTFEVIESAYYMLGTWPSIALLGLVVITGVWVTGVRALWTMKSRYPRQLREFFK